MSKIDIKKVVLYLFLIMLVSYAIGFSMIQNKGFFQLSPILAGENSSKEYNEKKDAVLNAVNKIVISTDSTDIRLLPANDQKVTAHLHGSYSTGRKDLPLKFTVENQGDTLNIEVKIINHIGFFHNRLQLDIYLPESFKGNLKTSTASGNCELNSLKELSEFNFSTSSGDFSGDYVSAKNIQLSSASGDLELSGICDTFSIHTASGEFHSDSLEATSAIMDTASGSFRINGKFGSFRFKSASGDLLAESFQAEQADVRTASGRVKLLGDPGNLESHSMSGEISLAYSDTDFNIAAHTMSGNVEIIIPENSDFNLSFNSASGNLRLDEDFPVTIRGKVNEHRFEGSVRNGNSMININTASGNATIKNQ